MLEPATGKLRELQLIELEMLCDFKAICEKHKLQYFLDSGTLLGAVRHRGFIPWDDDIDVVMPYKDYLKFLSVASKEFGNKYFLQTSDTDVDFYRCYARIRKNNTKFVDSYFLEWNIHHGIFLDIFPLVEVNPGIEYRIKSILLKLSHYMIMDNLFQIHYDDFKSVLGGLGARLVSLLHKIPLKTRCKFRRWLLSSIFNASKKKCVVYIWTSLSECLPKQLYSSHTQLEFEGELFNVPTSYKKYLEIIYGDYLQLPPENQRKGHAGESYIVDFENGCSKTTPEIY